MGKLKNAKIMLEEAVVDIVDEMTLEAWDEVLDLIEDKKTEIQEDVWNRITILLDDHEDLGLFDMDDVDEVLEESQGLDLNGVVDDYIYTNWDV